MPLQWPQDISAATPRIVQVGVAIEPLGKLLKASWQDRSYQACSNEWCLLVETARLVCKSVNLKMLERS